MKTNHQRKEKKPVVQRYRVLKNKDLSIYQLPKLEKYNHEEGDNSCSQALQNSQSEFYQARSFPSGETLKAEIASRTTGFVPILFHVVVFHVTMLPRLSM
jgi:hypothetical protein